MQQIYDLQVALEKTSLYNLRKKTLISFLLKLNFSVYLIWQNSKAINEEKISLGNFQKYTTF